MYSTCLFCNSALGANEAIEAFPVGRRLAFDAAKGRLWVVCRKCERWNLTPLEERWEAIEQCERAFSATRLRVSTDQVGLARLKEGLELVRIGEPQRPEMAAWRYGDQFGRRRRRNLIITGAAVAGAGVVLAGGWAAGVGLAVLGQSGNFVNLGLTAYRNRKRVRVPVGDGRFVETSLTLATRSRLVLDGDEVRLDLRMVPPGGTMAMGWHGMPMELRGEAAVRAAGALLPLVNRAGGAERDVRQAVDLLESSGSALDLFARGVAESRRRSDSAFWNFGDPGQLDRMPAPIRLALEMAAHEEQERRALEGELSELERAWKEAEEVAAIADDLFVEDGVRAKLSRLRGERE